MLMIKKTTCMQYLAYTLHLNLVCNLELHWLHATDANQNRGYQIKFTFQAFIYKTASQVLLKRTKQTPTSNMCSSTYF